MDENRSNDITLLNNQIIILDAWNKWKKKTNDNYQNRIDAKSESVEEQKVNLENYKKTLATLDYGRSLGALIMIIVCAVFYMVPSFIEFTKPYAPYASMATVLLVIPYFFWLRGSKKTIISNLLFWLSNGLILGVVLYVLSRKDGQPNLYYALFDNARFETVNRYFSFLALGSIVVLIASMIIRKIKYNTTKAKINKLIFECESSISEDNEAIQTLHEEREHLLVNKEKEYFSKYPLVLPEYTIPEVQRLLMYMINHRADTIKEAINLKKQEETLQNIKDDVKALRDIQQRTSDEILEIRNSNKKEETEVKEEKEDPIY